MGFFKRIFRSNMVNCPRCLGKGKVDMDDIRRLRKEIYWGPGKCAYCNGIGRVPPDRIEKVDAGFEYLTTDLTSLERLKLINGDKHALQRANEYKEDVQRLIEEIERLYYIENQEPNEIAENLFNGDEQQFYTGLEKQEVVDYIEKVIKSKLKD